MIAREQRHCLIGFGMIKRTKQHLRSKEQGTISKLDHSIGLDPFNYTNEAKNIVTVHTEMHS